MTEKALERLAEALDASDTEHTLEVYDSPGRRSGWRRLRDTAPIVFGSP
ncbi:hypothetical protein ACFV4I_24545 [Nocardiopsis alba]